MALYLVLTSYCNMYILVVLILYCIWCYCDTGKVRDRFSDMCMFKDGLRFKKWLNSVFINVIKEILYRS